MDLFVDYLEMLTY